MRAKEELKDLLSQLESFITTKTVVGEPIHMEDTILLPLVDVTFGVGAGAILVIQGGSIRMVNVKNQDLATRLVDMVPDVLERVKNGFEKEKENKQAREAVEKATEEEK